MSRKFGMLRRKPRTDRPDLPAAGSCVRVATIARVTSLRRLSVLFVVPLLLALAPAAVTTTRETPKAEKSQCSIRETGSAPPSRWTRLPATRPEDAPTEVTSRPTGAT